MPQDNLYNVVKKVLEISPESRNSDKKLIWDTLYSLRLCTDSFMTVEDFMKAPSFESITRARRKVQTQNPRLRASEPVEKMRRIKEIKKGNFIFDLFR